MCGDGRVNNFSEQCDDNNRRDGDGCNYQCQYEYCGDGILTLENPLDYYTGSIFPAPEQCDDGNVIDGDGCSSMCVGVSFDPYSSCMW